MDLVDAEARPALDVVVAHGTGLPRPDHVDGVAGGDELGAEVRAVAVARGRAPFEWGVSHVRGSLPPVGAENRLVGREGEWENTVRTAIGDGGTERHDAERHAVSERSRQGSVCSVAAVVGRDALVGHRHSQCWGNRLSKLDQFELGTRTSGLLASRVDAPNMSAFARASSRYSSRM